MSTDVTSSVQFSSGPGPIGSFGENVREDSAEILYRSFLQETTVSSAGMGRDVHSLMLPIQHWMLDSCVLNFLILLAC